MLTDQGVERSTAVPWVIQHGARTAERGEATSDRETLDRSHHLAREVLQHVRHDATGFGWASGVAGAG